MKRKKNNKEFKKVISDVKSGSITQTQTQTQKGTRNNNAKRENK